MNALNEKSLHPPSAGTVMTPNYLRSPKISVSPFCDCSNSGNTKDECDKFTEFFTENTCLRKLSLCPAAVWPAVYWTIFSYSLLLYISFICLSKLFSIISIFVNSALLVSFLLCSSIISFLYMSLLLSASPSNQIYPIAMFALLSLCIIEKAVILHHSAWMCVCVCMSVCVCMCLKAAAELRLQIFDRKRLFQLVRLYNDFN